MASVETFAVENAVLLKEIKRRDDESEWSRTADFIAARKIQAWFRGLLTRAHIRMLHKAATTIQRHWRGFASRSLASRFLIREVKLMWWRYYNEMATRIQALWRGYQARKNGLDLRKFHRWLESVYNRNSQALERMRKFREAELAQMRAVMERESMLWILFILFKLHHLLRTKCRPGTLTRIDRTRFTVIEEMMRCLEYTLYTAKRHRDMCDKRPPETPPMILKGTYFERCEKEIRDFEKSLGAGTASIFRSVPHDDEERMLKEMERLRRELESGKYEERSMRFTTITKLRCREDKTIRMMVGDYLPPPRDSFPSVRPPRNEAKELHGDFKVLMKPNELYEAINKMDCLFDQLRIKCPIHDLIYG